MYVELQGKELKKDWKDLLKKAINSDPNDENIGKEERLLIEDENPEILTLEFDKNNEKIFLTITHKYGYFSFDIPLDDDLMFEIVECLKSKAEKIKRLLEFNR